MAPASRSVPFDVRALVGLSEDEAFGGGRRLIHFGGDLLTHYVCSVSPLPRGNACLLSCAGWGRDRVVALVVVPSRRLFHFELVPPTEVAAALAAGVANVIIKHVHAHHPDLVSRIVGVDTVDHPGERQIAAYAHRYFKAADRVR